MTDREKELAVLIVELASIIRFGNQGFAGDIHIKRAKHVIEGFPDAVRDAGELDYRAYCLADPDHKAEGTLEALATCAHMLEEYGPDCFPANEHGQVHFARGMIDSTAAEIRTFLARQATKPTKDEWRCVNCKHVVTSASEPRRCPECRHITFAHIQPLPPPRVAEKTFQTRVQPWLIACFGETIAGDREERNHRFLEEALELVQSCDCTAHEARQLVDYVYGRDIGEPSQEVGGVMVTLAALCLANDLDMHGAGETELERIWTKVEQIRAKQAAKPKHSALPQAPVSEEDA